MGSNKSKKVKLLKIQIRSAQNVGKVWISREKNSRAPFGAIPGNFSMDQKNKQKMTQQMSSFLGGHLQLSTQGGEIGLLIWPVDFTALVSTTSLDVIVQTQNQKSELRTRIT